MRHLSELSEIADPVTLNESEVHIWCCAYGSIRDPTLLSRYDALMTEEERARHRRFYFEKDRHMFLVTRALVRTVLSRYAPTAPEDWRFDKNEWGRPHIAPPRVGPSFNLSNTHGLVACAVARSPSVGIDVENTSRKTEPQEIAHRFFSTTEAEALLALPESEQRERFFSLWTLKEAYIKARGMGLAIPLGQFSYTLAPTIRIAFDDKLDDDPSRWKLGLWRATDDHFLAIAIDRPNATFTARHVVPLSDAYLV